MLKRLFIIGFFTGSAQLFSIWILKYLSHQEAVGQLKSIGQVDSIVMLVTNLVAMGLQSTAIRDLATIDRWRDEFARIQSGRICMGLLLLYGCILGFVNPYYLAFAIAPFLAWSGDYALYARGRAVVGSIISFIRIVFPFCMVLVASRYTNLLGFVYALSIIVVYTFNNIFIAFILKTAYIPVPHFRDLRRYMTSLPLGVVVLSMYFIGLGLMMIVPYFYIDTVVATAFIGLKFYMIFKGVLRIVHQAFIKELADYEICFKVDQLTSLTGIAFLTFVTAFPKTFIGTFFGEIYIPDYNFFILLGVAAFIYSVFSSLIIKAMLEKRDKPYAVLSIIAACVTISTTVVLSYFISGSSGIGISLILGEALFATSLVLMMNRPQLIRERAIFFINNSPIIALPFIVRYIGSDKLIYFITASIAYTLIAAALYYKKFSILAPTNLQKYVD